MVRRRGSRALTGHAGMMTDREKVSQLVGSDFNDEVIVGIVKKKVSKKARILELYDMGLDVDVVAKIMAVIRQHVYNTVKGRDGEVRRKNEGRTLKEQIIEMWEEGASQAEIKRATGSANYVWKVVDEYEKQREEQEA